MILTFVDAGVLIAAFRGQGELGRRALNVLSDPDRDYASSPFVRLEVLPKPIYLRREIEVRFYNAFFSSVSRWVESVDDVVERAYRIATSNGLSGIDALHVAAAVLVGADELVTTEKAGKPIHRVADIVVVSLYPI